MTLIFKRLLQLKSASGLANRIIPKYIPIRRIYKLQWPSAPRNIYIAKKPGNQEVFYALIQLIKYINQTYPNLNIMLNHQVVNELQQYEFTNNDEELRSLRVFNGDIESIKLKTDLLISIGGDGTILHAVSRFLSYVPPVLSFSMGTLGFLLPFDFSGFKSVLQLVLNNESRVLKRSRLQCHMKHNGINSAPDVHRMNPAMNEISLHRGSEENMITLDIFVDKELLTNTTADGILVSTPTGSTAYSLSSGGPIVHPMIESTSIIPICPRSLSFRPLLLPSSSEIMMRLSPRNRNILIKLSIDGIRQNDFATGDELYISRPSDLDDNIWCVTRGENEWTRDINELLGFNKSFKERLLE